MASSVPRLFEAISRELHQLAELAVALQAQLSPCGHAGQDIEALQRLDVLTQTLTCLTAFTADVGTQLDCRCALNVEDALDDICLRALAERLRGNPHSTAAPALSDVELF